MPDSTFAVPTTADDRARNYSARKMYKSARARGFEKDAVKAILLERFGVISSRDCTLDQLQQMREHFKMFPLPNAPQPKPPNKAKKKFRIQVINGQRTR